MDEFIVLYGRGRLPDYLRGLPEDATQLLMGWQNFGSGGHEAKPDGLVMENYTMRDIGCMSVGSLMGAFDFGKSIFRPAFCKSTHCHSQNMAWGRTENPGPKLSRLHIAVNHYCTKSRAEFMERNKSDAWWSKESGQIGYRENPDNYFNVRNTNIIFDDFLKKNYAEKVKKILQKLS